MATYTDPDLPSDEGTLAEQLLDLLADQIPGWDPRDGQVEPPLAEAFAVVLAAVNALLKEQARQDYAGFGETVLGLPAISAKAATSTVRVQFSDTTGRTLPAGAQLTGTAPTGEVVVLITLADAHAAVGASLVTGVPVAVREPGVAGNAVTGTLRLQDAYGFVSSVVLEAATGNGVDAEERDAYLVRAVRRARRFLAPPVTVADFQAAALDTPGVARCLAINLLDPANPAVTSPGHITLFPLAANGNAVTGASVTPPTAGSVAAQLLADVSGPSDRLLQVAVHIGTPSINTFPITFSATVRPGADGPATISAAETAAETYLSKTDWGRDEDAAGLWRPLSTVHYLEVAQVIQEVPGIDVLVDLVIDGGRVDRPLTGTAPLPNVTATGTLAT